MTGIVVMMITAVFINRHNDNVNGSNHYSIEHTIDNQIIFTTTTTTTATTTCNTIATTTTATTTTIATINNDITHNNKHNG